MKIAFCAAEAFPFVKRGGLGDVCGALPLALEKIGVDVSLFVPRYGCAREEGFKIEKVRERVAHTIFGKNVKVYFIEDEHLFGRDEVYGDSNGDYEDNLERFQHYCAHVLEFLKQHKIKVDILHCHDWHAALIPVYLKERYASDPFFAKTKSILTIHNIAHQGLFPGRDYPKLGLRPQVFDNFEFYGKVNFLKAGIVCSDKVTTVSPQYAREILTKEFGCGLEGVLRSRGDKIVGILNGLDEELWNPLRDHHITKKFSLKDYDKAKPENKQALQKQLGLPEEAQAPLFSFVSRLWHQKGVDLLLDVIGKIRERGAQIVLMGVGDEQFQKKFVDLAKRYPQRIAVQIKFDEELAHRIYAGSDFFLMPSRFEPCGLSQLISLHYGTVPVVYKTGGLADTVRDFRADPATGNGLVFDRYTKEDFLKTILAAFEMFGDKGKMKQLRENALRSDFSWGHSAAEYKEFYRCLLSE